MSEDSAAPPWGGDVLCCGGVGGWIRIIGVGDFVDDVVSRYVILYRDEVSPEFRAHFVLFVTFRSAGCMVAERLALKKKHNEFQYRRRSVMLFTPSVGGGGTRHHAISGSGAK